MKEKFRIALRNENLKIEFSLKRKCNLDKLDEELLTQSIDMHEV